jgi:hypothetical protein
MQIKLTPIAGGRPIELERELTVVGPWQHQWDSGQRPANPSRLNCNR